MEIAFHFLKKTTLRNRTSLKVFIETMFRKEKTKAQSLTYIFCDDTYLLDINRTNLKHDYYTDIITFNLAYPGNETVIGEIYISVDMVAHNALKFKATKARELHRVIFHGILHLCGYRDKSAKDQKEMTRMENYYLDQYFLKSH